MAITYNKLWDLLAKQNLKKKDLMAIAHISRQTIAKLSKNETVNTQIINKICKYLNCNIEDIMEYDKSTNIEINKTRLKPILKWAGGKTQLLNDLIPLIPNYTGKYIEPFVGGGALFFALQPKNAVIADSNPELINTYKQIAEHVDQVIEKLSQFKNDEEEFYQVRSLNPASLTPIEAAARFIYLNKTCFNGLYRVNRKGEFNVPFGHYKKPKIVDTEALIAASKLLKDTTIICADYKKVLNKYAQPNDFVFLDPPYLPVGKYSDFKRYTKEQFYEEDHQELALEYQKLTQKKVYSILTNSNTPLVHDLYDDFDMRILSTKRHISSKSSSRKGEDVIITNYPTDKTFNYSDQVEKFPPTRFMGSKRKLLSNIWNAASQFNYDTVLDLFSGSGIVSYLFKANNKTVLSNDYMRMSYCFAKAMIENNDTLLPKNEAQELMKPNHNDGFVQKTFKDLYYTEHDTKLIDNIRTNIMFMKDDYKRYIAMTALIRACMKKRPRGIFTYVGHRYDDGRKDLKKSFEEQFLENVEAVNDAVYNNHKDNKCYNRNALKLKLNSPDLVYIDPPYYTPKSDNGYVRRYHFVEGLARNWEGVEIQQNTKTKKFKNYPTPFAKKDETEQAFKDLFNQYKDAILIVSYSSNSLPSRYQMVSMLKDVKHSVRVIPIDYHYSFGNQVKTARNKVKEYLFVAY